MSGRGDDRISMYEPDGITLGPVARSLIQKARGDGGVEQRANELKAEFFQKEGVKHDHGKRRVDLVPTEAINALADILTAGERVALIPGFQDYLATSTGRIFSLHCNRFLSQNKIWCGYMRVWLGGKKRVLVHRLVLSAFSGSVGDFVNHKNGIKDDNRIENLEWCTKSENTKHAFKIGLMNTKRGQDVYNAKFTNREVEVIRGLYKMGATQVEIGELFGVRQANISDIIRCKCYKGV